MWYMMEVDWYSERIVEELFELVFVMGNYFGIFEMEYLMRAMAWD